MKLCWRHTTIGGGVGAVPSIFARLGVTLVGVLVTQRAVEAARALAPERIVRHRIGSRRIHTVGTIVAQNTCTLVHVCTVGAVAGETVVANTCVRSRPGVVARCKLIAVVLPGQALDVYTGFLLHFVVARVKIDSRAVHAATNFENLAVVAHVVVGAVAAINIIRDHVDVHEGFVDESGILP